MKASKLIKLFLLSSFVLAGCEFSDLMFWKKKDEPEQQENQEGEEQTPGEGGEQSGEQGGEGGEVTPPEDPTFKTTVNVKMEKLLKGDNGYYNIDYQYSDGFFKEDAEVYDKDLAMLSLGAALSATYQQWVTDFLSTCKFENPTLHDFDKEPTKDTLGYALAHKEIDGSELFTVLIRGHEYKAEWQNNFIIGEEGDHEGWLARSTELYSALSSYINTYKASKTVKLWIVGYSRAGAISNLLSSLILRSDGINVNPKNMFVYTFEAPASLCEEHVHEYKNIHNIINSADLITYIPPTQYGLSRVGTDFEIYDSDISNLIKKFDSQVEIPEFVECDKSTFNNQDIEDDVDFTRYIINDIFSNKNNATYSAHTRELYVANYQEGLSYSIGLMFALTGTTRSQMMVALTNLGMGAITMLSDTTGAALAEFLKTYLNQDNVDYDNDKLIESCAVLVKAATYLFITELFMFMGSSYGDNLKRSINMHYPEVTYTLLQNAHSKLD